MVQQRKASGRMFVKKRDGREEPVHFEAFFKVFSKNKVLTSKIMAVLSSSSTVEVRVLMEFIMKSTMNPGLKLSQEYEARIRQVFQDHLGDNKQIMNFEDFKKCFDKKAFYTQQEGCTSSKGQEKSWQDQKGKR